MAVAFVVAAFSFLGITLLKRLDAIDFWIPSSFVIIGIFITLVLTYLCASAMWRFYSGLFERKRTWNEAIIDTGMLSIGKYMPGKIWGVIARGVVTEQGLRVDKGGAIISLTEQVIVLVIGCLAGSCLLILGGYESSALVKWLYVFMALVISMIVPRLMVAMIAMLPRFHADGARLKERLSMRISLQLGLGYSLMWLLTGASFAFLAYQHTGADPFLLFLVGLFLVSSLVGWLAVFVPAGLGVREAAFAALAAPYVPWQEALAWVLMHRLLLSIGDLIFGVSVLAIMMFGGSSVRRG